MLILLAHFVDKLSEWLGDWVTDGITDWLIMTDRLTDWSWLTDWLIMTDCPINVRKPLQQMTKNQSTDWHNDKVVWLTEKVLMPSFFKTNSKGLLT